MPIEGTNTEIQFVFIDTIILCGLTHPTKKWIPPSGPASVNAAEDQWEWIEKTLAASAAKWLFVVGHYPGVYLAIINNTHNYRMARNFRGTKYLRMSSG